MSRKNLKPLWQRITDAIQEETDKADRAKKRGKPRSEAAYRYAARALVRLRRRVLPKGAQP